MELEFNDQAKIAVTQPNVLLDTVTAHFQDKCKNKQKQPMP